MKLTASLLFLALSSYSSVLARTTYHSRSLSPRGYNHQDHDVYLAEYSRLDRMRKMNKCKLETHRLMQELGSNVKTKVLSKGRRGRREVVNPEVEQIVDYDMDDLDQGLDYDLENLDYQSDQPAVNSKAKSGSRFPQYKKLSSYTTYNINIGGDKVQCKCYTNCSIYSTCDQLKDCLIEGGYGEYVSQFTGTCKSKSQMSASDVRNARRNGSTGRRNKTKFEKRDYEEYEADKRREEREHSQHYEVPRN